MRTPFAHPLCGLRSRTLLARKGEGGSADGARGNGGGGTWKWEGRGKMLPHPTRYTKRVVYALFYFILLCLYYYIYSMEIKYQRQKKSKKAVFESEWRRNGQSGPDREIFAKSQRLASSQAQCT